MNKMSKSVEWERELPVKYKMAEGYVFSDEPRDIISFTAEATGWQLLSLSRKELDSLVIQVPSRPGNHSWNSEQIRQMIKEKDIDQDVSIPEVSPFRLTISIVEAFTKCVPLKIAYRVSHPSGFQSVSPIRVDPDTVCITGPKESVGTIDHWYTDSLILENVSQTQEGLLSLKEDDKGLLEFSPSEVNYSLEVAEFTELKKYVPVRMVNQPDVDSISLFPERVLVSMRVPLNKYESAKEQELQLFINLANNTLDSNSAKVQIPKNLPDWMKHVQVSPERVEYYFVSTDTSSTNNTSRLSDQ